MVATIKIPSDVLSLRNSISTTDNPISVPLSANGGRYQAESNTRSPNLTKSDKTIAGEVHSGRLRLVARIHSALTLDPDKLLYRVVDTEIANASHEVGESDVRAAVQSFRDTADDEAAFHLQLRFFGDVFDDLIVAAVDFHGDLALFLDYGNGMPTRIGQVLAQVRRSSSFRFHPGTRHLQHHNAIFENDHEIVSPVLVWPR